MFRRRRLGRSLCIVLVRSVSQSIVNTCAWDGGGRGGREGGERAHDISLNNIQPRPLRSLDAPKETLPRDKITQCRARKKEEDDGAQDLNNRESAAVFFLQDLLRNWLPIGFLALAYVCHFGYWRIGIVIGVVEEELGRGGKLEKRCGVYFSLVVIGGEGKV